MTVASKAPRPSSERQTPRQPKLRLAPGSTDLHRVMEEGVIMTPPRHARPVGINQDGSVNVELFEPAPAPSSAGVWLRAARAYSLTATAAPCIAVALYGVARGWAVAPVVALLALVGVVLLQVAVTLLNDVEDHRRRFDLPGGMGGAGVSQAGWLSSRQVHRASLALFAFALLLGIPALLRAPLPMLVIVGVAALGAFGYSGRPFSFKYRALGDVIVVLLCGPLLTAGFCHAAFGVIDEGVVGLGVTFGLAASAILHANNLQDRQADRARGAITLAGVLPDSVSRSLLPVFVLGAFVAWVATGLLLQLHIVVVMIPLMALVPAVRVVRTLIQEPTAPLLRVMTAQAHLVLGAALAVAFLVDIFLF